MSNLTPWDRMRLIEANSKAIHGLELGWFHAASELPTYLDTLIQYGRDNSSGNGFFSDIARALSSSFYDVRTDRWDLRISFRNTSVEQESAWCGVLELLSGGEHANGKKKVG